MRLLTPLFACFLFILSLTPAWAQRTRVQPVEVDRIVAVVGNEVITLTELRDRLDTAIRQLRQQGTPLPPMELLERQMLERLIMDRAQMQLARDTGLLPDDMQLDQAIERIAASNKLTVQQFRSVLQKDGIPFSKFREEIRSEMTIARLRQREVESRIVISEGEIDNFLANQGDSDKSEEVRIAHILLRAPEGASPEQLKKLKARAEQALARARAGENFAELTAAFSDAQDALKGGDLGYRPLDRLPGLYAEAAEQLEVGAVSPVLRSSAGFHIVKLLDKKGGGAAPPPLRQTRARHILIKVNEGVSESEARRKIENLRERLVNGQDFAELARLFSQDGSAVRGGDLGWMNAGDTVPEFERAMDALKVNQLSDVVQTPFGMHLIEVQERREKDMTEESKRLQARQALRERKLEEAYQDWLRQLRDQTYVEVRLEEK